MSSHELIVYHEDDPGLPKDSNLLYITAHGERKGKETIIVPNNIYIILPCVDDYQYSSSVENISYSDLVKTCNRLDGPENIEKEGLDRCIDGIDDPVINRNIQKMASDKAIYDLFPKIKDEQNINDLFKNMCSSTSDKYPNASNGCNRFCINGPGTLIKNQIFGGSYHATERVYGSRLTMYQRKTEEKFQIILQGYLDKKREEEDPEGYAKVQEAIKVLSPEFKQRIIKNIDLKKILFYYTNFGITPFQHPNINLTENDKIIKKHPLVIFLGDPCAADKKWGLGIDAQYIINRQLQITGRNGRRKRRMLTDKIHSWIGSSHNTFVQNISDIEKADKPFTIDNNPDQVIFKGWPSLISSIIPYENPSEFHIIDTGLRSSTDMHTSSVHIPIGIHKPNAPWRSSRTIYKEFFTENPCNRKRPKLNEFLYDHRSIINRTKRNITSNINAKIEVELCNKLAKVGLGVGSKLFYVNTIDVSNKSNKSKKIGNKNDIFISLPYRSGNISKPIGWYTELSDGYKGFLDHYDYNFFLHNIKGDNKITWDFIMLTEIKSIEKNVIGLSYRDKVFNSSISIYGGNKSDEDMKTEYLGQKITELAAQYYMTPDFAKSDETLYGMVGIVTDSIVNFPVEILNNCFWKPNTKLIDLSSDGKKNISGKEAYKQLSSVYKKGGYKKKKTIKKKRKKVSVRKKKKNYKQSTKKKCK